VEESGRGAKREETLRRPYRRVFHWPAERQGVYRGMRKRILLEGLPRSTRLLARAVAISLGAVGLLAGSILGISGSAFASVPGAVNGVGFSFHPASTVSGQPPPTVFDYYMKPGESVQGHVVLENLSNAQEVFRIWTANAFNTHSGAFSIEGEKDAGQGVGGWIHLGLYSSHLAGDDFELPSADEVTFTFRVDVPVNATPGDHAGGIVALEVGRSSPTPGAPQISLHLGLAIPVFIQVAGALRPGASLAGTHSSIGGGPFAWLGGTEDGHTTVVVRNTGNTLLSGTVTGIVKSSTGAILEHLPKKTVTDLIPGASAHLAEPLWHANAIEGPASVQVRFTASDLKNPLVASESAWSFPWLGLLVFVVMVAGGGFLIVFRRKRPRLDHPKDAPSGWEPPDVARRVAPAATGSVSRS